MNRRLIAVAGMLLGLAGCFWEEPTSPSGYPDLKVEDVVGCWFYQSQEPINGVTCFDRAGGYYFVDSIRYFYAEDSGSYRLSGIRMYQTYRIRTSAGRNVVDSILRSFKRDGDKLCEINPGGDVAPQCQIQVSPDSFPDGLKPWRFFKKPAGWDSLVKPMK